jgi:hypothetical protein
MNAASFPVIDAIEYVNFSLIMAGKMVGLQCSIWTAGMAGKCYNML